MSMNAGSSAVIDCQFNKAPITTISGVNVPIFSTIIPPNYVQKGLSIYTVFQHSTGTTTTNYRLGTTTALQLYPTNNVVTPQSLRCQFVNRESAPFSTNIRIVRGISNAVTGIGNNNAGVTGFTVTTFIVLTANAASDVDVITPLFWLITVLR